MVRIILEVVSFVVILFAVMSFQAEAAFLVKDGAGADSKEASQEIASYEEGLGISLDEGDSGMGLLAAGEIPLDMKQAQLEMKKERAKIIQERKERKKKEEMIVKQEVERIKKEIALIESGQFTDDPIKEGRRIFFFQMLFLLGCAGAAFPFIFKNGKIMRFLNE